MDRPKYLNIGDTVAIVATAKKLNPNEIDGAIQHIESWGFNVVLGPNLYSEFHQFAGTDEQRANDLQWAIDQPEVKAVLFARGGYGTARIIDAIDWSVFQSNPKWLCGFSDLTVLHSHVNKNLGVQTMHSTMPIFFKDGTPNEGSESLRNSLLGESNTIDWLPHVLNRNGNAKGQLVGGNLSVLYSIMGTPSQMNFDGEVLFLEDLTENLYHIDRMMMQFKRAGHLASLAGLVVGQFTEMEDNSVSFGKSAEEILLDAVSEYDYPVAFNAPVGHVAKNLTAIYGATIVIRVSDQQSNLHYF